MGEHLLTTKDLADYFRCSTKTIYRKLRAKKIPYIRLGWQYRIRQKDLEWIGVERPYGR